MDDTNSAWFRFENRRSLLTAWACASWLCVVNAEAQVSPVPAETPAAVTADPAPIEAEVAPGTAAEPSAPAEVPEPVVTAQVPETSPAIAPVVPPTPVAPIAPVAPVAAPVSPAWTPVFSGSYFTRYEFRANYDDMGVSRARFLEGDAVFYRARLGIGTGLIDLGDLKVGLQFTPQTAGVFGAMGPNTIADAALGLHEGYGRVQGDYVRFDSGRFELNYGDSLILGNLDWNEVGRSFDGVRARVSTSPTSAWLDVFATLVDEGRDPALVGPAAKGLGFGDGDLYLFGIYGALGPVIKAGLDLDLYALGRGWHDQKGLKVDAANPMSPTYRRESAREVTFGVRVKQKLGLIDYRFEGGLQTGTRPGAPPTVAMMPPATEQKNVDVLAYHGDAELGVNLAKDRLRLGVQGIYASGNDTKTADKNEGWDELYPTAHKFLGLADVFHQGGIKRTNVMSYVLHVTAKPTAALAIQADGHMFSRIEKLSPTGKDGQAGAELDLGAVYTLAKGLKVRALYAVFVPNKDFYPVSTPAAPLTGEADPIHFGELELRYDLP